MIMGARIIQSVDCVNRVQFRFPRSKKKRIRAKWAKREENVRYIPAAFLVGDTLYCHPYIAARVTSLSSQS